MQTLFVDAWFLIALCNRFDAHHSVAQRLDDTLRRATLITHDAVLSEVLTYFSAAGALSRQTAVATVRRALNRYVVEPVSRELFVDALHLYARRTDKEYSHIDCISMSLMKRLALTHVLTNDRHFRQEGFTVVNE
jgi:predicted nucleic acid-binding protein